MRDSSLAAKLERRCYDELAKRKDRQVFRDNDRTDSVLGTVSRALATNAAASAQAWREVELATQAARQAAHANQLSQELDRVVELGYYWRDRSLAAEHDLLEAQRIAEAARAEKAQLEAHAAQLEAHAAQLEAEKARLEAEYAAFKMRADHIEYRWNRTTLVANRLGDRLEELGVDNSEIASIISKAKADFAADFGKEPPAG